MGGGGVLKQSFCRLTTYVTIHAYAWIVTYADSQQGTVAG